MHLPVELWHHIISFLTISDAVSLGYSSVAMYRIVLSYRQSLPIDEKRAWPAESPLLHSLVQHHTCVTTRCIDVALYMAAHALRLTTIICNDIDERCFVERLVVAHRPLRIFLGATFSFESVAADAHMLPPAVELYKRYCGCDYHHPIMLSGNRLECVQCARPAAVVSPVVDPCCQDCATRCDQCGVGYMMDFCMGCSDGICNQCCCAAGYCGRCNTYGRIE